MRHPITRLFLISIFFSTSTVFSQTAFHEISVDRLKRYDKFIESEVSNGRIAGAVTVIYKNGEKVHEAALGFADLENQIPMAKNQIFYIQSMTKPIITTALMMLYEEGHFMLNDPLSK